VKCRLFALFVFLAACETAYVPMPETPTFAGGDGGVQAIRSPLTLDARIFVHARINYDVRWDGVLNGAQSGSVATLIRAMWPAAAMACPRLWIWVSHDPSGSATWALEQSYSMPPTATAIQQSDVPPDPRGKWFSYSYCDYVFREGGGETWRSGIPVQSGDNWVGYGLQCPGATTGPTALTGIIHIVVPPGSANQYNLPIIDGPANNKGLWAPIAKYGCGWAADSAWDIPSPLHIKFCQAACQTCNSCAPGGDVDLVHSW
jgi:hypothetical protein